MPDEIRHDLIVRVLLDKADLRGRRQRVQLGKGGLIVVNCALHRPGGNEGGLGMAQKRRLPAAGGTAEDHVFSPVKGKLYPVKRPHGGLRIGERQLIKP